MSDIQQARQTLAFFRSVILSGESWTDTCQLEYNAAQDVLNALPATDTAECERLREALETLKAGLLASQRTDALTVAALAGIEEALSGGIARQERMKPTPQEKPEP